MSSYLRSREASAADVGQLLLYCYVCHIKSQNAILSLLRTHSLVLAQWLQQIRKIPSFAENSLCLCLRVAYPLKYLHWENDEGGLGLVDQNHMKSGEVSFVSVESEKVPVPYVAGDLLFFSRWIVSAISFSVLGEDNSPFSLIRHVREFKIIPKA